MADDLNRLAIAEEINAIGPAAYTMLSKANATGSVIGPIKGGPYFWSADGAFNGATLTLERELRDGSFAGLLPAATLTEPGLIQIGVGHGAYLRVKVTGGPPTDIYSELSGTGA